MQTGRTTGIASKRKRPKWTSAPHKPLHVPRALGFEPLRQLLGQLCQHIERPVEHAIELGCGAEDTLGQLLPQLPVAHWTLIDNDPAAVEAIRQRHLNRRTNVVLGDACDLSSVPDSSVGLVVSLCVTDQIEDAEAFQRELGRVLMPGGLFIEVNDQTETSASYRGR